MKSTLVKTLGLLALSLPVFAPVAQAYDFTVGGIYYNYTSDRKGAVVTYASLQTPSYSGNVRIPAEVTYRMETLKVRQIDDRAFFNCQGVTSVTIPEGIVAIGEQTFSHCYSMTSVTIPSTVNRIGDYAFEFCEDLPTVTLPAALSSLGYAVFQQCAGLTEFVVAEGNPYYVADDGILYLADKSVLVQYPGSKPGTEFVIPDQVSQLPDYAFSANRKLEKITIGASLAKVPAGVFSECSALRDIVVDDASESMSDIDGVLFDKRQTTLMQYPIGRVASDYVVPEGTRAIADLAMSSCRIGSIDLPESLSSVGTFAFVGATGVKQITCRAIVPPSVGAMAFDDNVLASTPLYVDQECLSTYKMASGWSSFRNIYHIGYNGIDNVDADGAVTVSGLTVSAPGQIEAYDVAGRLVAAGTGSLTLPCSGLYIVKTGQRVVKVSV